MLAPLIAGAGAARPAAGRRGVLLAAACGFAVAGMLPTANGLFVQALPHGYRARAFGVMQSGVQVMQGGRGAVTGLLANHVPAAAGGRAVERRPAWC